MTRTPWSVGILRSLSRCVFLLGSSLALVLGSPPAASGESGPSSARQWWPLPARGGEAREEAVVDGFEENAALERWRGYFGDDAGHRDDPADDYRRASRAGEPVKSGKRSLRVGPIPPVPPYTRGLGHYFLFRAEPLPIPEGAAHIGLQIHGTGQPSSVRILYKARGKKYWRTLEQDTSHEGWRWVAWPNVHRLGPTLILGFDFVNESKRPLTWYVDDVTWNRAGDRTAPEAPTKLRARPLPLHVELSWRSSPDDDLHGTWVFRSGVGQEEPVFLAPVRSDRSSYTDWDLPLDGGRYRYHLVAVDHAGQGSEPSKPQVVDVPPFERDEALLARLHDVVAGVVMERCGPFERWGTAEDLRMWRDLAPELNFRTWFQWGAYETGWFPSPRLRKQPFRPFANVVKTVRKNGGLFCGAVCCKYGSARQVPLGRDDSMAPYWTGLGTVKSADLAYAFRDNTRFSKGLDLTVAHAVARLDANADMLWFDMQPFDPADQRTLRNRLKWEALRSHEKGHRDSPDVLVGSDIYHQAFLFHPGRKDASCFDYRVEQGSKLFYEVPGEEPYWGNSLLRDASGRLMTHRDVGKAAHLDVSSTKIGFCHGWLYYTGSNWTAGLYERVADVPVLCFIDWRQPTTDFMKVPAAEQANFLRITAAEVIACGWTFCFPVQAWNYKARRQGTYPVIRTQLRFYRHWADLYKNREICWTRTPSARGSDHSFPRCLTVRVGIEGGGGVMENAGHEGLSYVVSDQPHAKRRLVHLFNHNVEDYRVVAQQDVEVTVPIEARVKRAFLISPDFADPTQRRELPLVVVEGGVRCRLDLEYHAVIVLEQE